MSEEKRSSGQVETSISFAQRLRRLRKAAALTQEELAARAGLSTKAISMLERGERRQPYLHTVRSLASALELTDDERATLIESVRGGQRVSRPIDAGRPRLPGPLTSLVGRGHEMKELSDLLRRPEVRLLTLTGVGGVGKTRLAIEVAGNGAHLFPDGISFVALAPVNDPALVVPSIALRLGLGALEEPALGESLRAHLRAKQSLIVLDNFEHVTAAAADVSGLIEDCPLLVVLVTSRAPLRVRGEYEYHVPPLGLPPSSTSPIAPDVMSSPSGQLFVERAQATLPSFELTDTNSAAVAAICRRLAGLPLALELAAAKVRFLDPPTLLARLDRTLSTGGARDLPVRQRTMRATLDWSHDLLPEEGRRLFRRLSVFSGGFSLDAAEVVCSSADLDDIAIVGGLGDLVDQSLVVTTGRRGATRYGMLEPVRQYAIERLEDAAEIEQIKRRHAQHFVAFSEEAEPLLRGPEQVEWLGRLEDELGNVRLALTWCLEHGDVDAVARHGWSTWIFWWLRGRLDEGRRWMEEALAISGDAPTRTRASLLFVAGTLAQGRFDRENARAMLEESLHLFREMGDGGRAAYPLGGLGLVFVGLQDFERGLLLLREAIDRYLDMGHKWPASPMLGFAAATSLNLGEIASARQLAEQGLSLAREVGASDAMYLTLHALSAVARAEDDNQRAVELLMEGLELSAEVEDQSSVAYYLEELAAVAASEDKLERAATLWGAAEAILETTDVVAYAHASERSAYRRRVSEARERADEAEWQKSWSSGRSMAMGEVDVEARATE